MATAESLFTIGLLGAAHGVNPAMGWLFAVALGLQRQDRRAVWGALGPMAIGHALAIGAAVLVASVAGRVLPGDTLRVLVSILLFGLGVLHLVRHGHVHRGGMCVGARDLAVWSFLVASVHGAGLMMLPFVLGGGAAGPPHGAHDAGGAGANNAGHASHALHMAAGLPDGPSAGLLAALVHTLGYLLVTGLIATIVYEKLGLRMLCKLWINMNVIWAGALILTAVLCAWP